MPDPLCARYNPLMVSLSKTDQKAHAHGVVSIDLIDQFDLRDQTALGVAVSGGPDSMALAVLLSHWAQAQTYKPHIHVLIVDHNLRAESTREAKEVHARIAAMPHLTPVILNAQLHGQTQKIQETARHARYELMAIYCKEHAIPYLFLGHHRNDQAETVLFRLAKGSGLDGLSGMRARQNYNHELTLLRPFLNLDKSDLHAFCDAHTVDYVLDPSNQNPKFARIRLRQAQESLEQEGLSAKRISTLAMRMNRAKQALDFIAESNFKENLVRSDSIEIVLKSACVTKTPDEIGLRTVIYVMRRLFCENRTYDPRMEKIERLFDDLKKSLEERAPHFRKRTLGGLIVSVSSDKSQIHIEREPRAHKSHKSNAPKDNPKDK